MPDSCERNLQQNLLVPFCDSLAHLFMHLLLKLLQIFKVQFGEYIVIKGGNFLT